MEDFRATLASGSISRWFRPANISCCILLFRVGFAAGTGSAGSIGLGKISDAGEHVVFVDEFDHKFHNIDNPDTLRTTWDIAYPPEHRGRSRRKPGKLIPPC